MAGIIFPKFVVEIHPLRGFIVIDDFLLFYGVLRFDLMWSTTVQFRSCEEYWRECWSVQQQYTFHSFMMSPTNCIRRFDNSGAIEPKSSYAPFSTSFFSSTIGFVLLSLSYLPQTTHTYTHTYLRIHHHLLASYNDDNMFSLCIPFWNITSITFHFKNRCCQ